MARTNSEVRRGEAPPEGLVTWEAGDGECRIVCPARLLESIRHECAMAARGPVALGRGGALLGESSGGTYRVRSWHPIPCRHQRGPSFLLTKEEVAGLKDFLARLPALTGRKEDQIIGWFVSHPFTSAVLRDDEISLHQRFFRSNDLFLMLEIHGDGAAVVTVHRGAQPLEPRWRILPAPPSRSAPPGAAAVARESREGQSSESPRPRAGGRARSAGPVVPALVLLVVALSGAAWLYFRQEAPAPPPAPVQPLSTLSLRVLRQGQSCVIRWNSLEPSLANARRAELLITDRGVTTVEALTPAQIRAGSFACNSSSATFEVKMTVDVDGGRKLSERVIFGP